MFKAGDVVTFRAGWCDAAEVGTRHVVVEWNGDRGIIEPETWEGHIRPQEAVTAEQIQAAE
jgi:hypothetical protein